MRLLCATHTLAPLGALSAQIPTDLVGIDVNFEELGCRELRRHLLVLGCDSLPSENIRQSRPYIRQSRPYIRQSRPDIRQSRPDIKQS